MTNTTSIANKITLLRTLICPFSFFALIYFFPKNTTALIIAFFIIGISEISDILDGWIARKTNQVTAIGKLIDPLSDSLCHNIVYLGLYTLGLINPWLLVCMIARDIVVVYVRFCSLLNQNSENKAMGALITGKIKAHAQAYYSIIILAVYIIKMTGNINHLDFFLYLQWFVALITIFSMFHYLWNKRQILVL